MGCNLCEVGSDAERMQLREHCREDAPCGSEAGAMPMGGLEEGVEEVEDFEVGDAALAAEAVGE